MLLGLDVLPEYRRQGLASELMRRYLAIQKERERKRFFSPVWTPKWKCIKKWDFRMMEWRILLGRGSVA